ncbi:MAG: addiction module antitoxin RelB [Burkholderiales bacterium RIFCSPHIGHO2_12_FULL_69_20]|nr:MAG: addiction module antitoxin RelB [Burkholderiales bacterium RIFCSPHIGHO2_12_FULL_69_20]
MPDTVTELAEMGKALSPEERSRLVDLLLESLHEAPASEVEAAWAAEIESRLAAHDRGEVEAVEAERVFAEASRIAR